MNFSFPIVAMVAYFSVVVYNFFSYNLFSCFLPRMVGLSPSCMDSVAEQLLLRMLVFLLICFCQNLG